jgi:hypothetical protein
MIDTNSAKTPSLALRDMEWSYLVDGENLTVALLNLLELSQKVPTRAQNTSHRHETHTKAKTTMVSSLTRQQGTDQNLDLERTSLVAQSFMR